MFISVPNQGEVPFIAVWCRVVRARSDGRFVATFWPLYVLTSELPLDMNVCILDLSNYIFINYK